MNEEVKKETERNEETGKVQGIFTTYDIEEVKSEKVKKPVIQVGGIAVLTVLALNILGTILTLFVGDITIQFDIMHVGALFFRLLLLFSMQYAVYFGVFLSILYIFRKQVGTFLNTWLYITGFVTLLMYIGFFLECLVYNG